ncbi:short chain dehydrogenase [Aliidiomarina minuta]|uniref:Short chain dehydrogenase n=1 Tax=Aliidiomarina minuta TaxID=880057 RepID=A0A432W7C7_9GAMM|nr:SDR family oxidoreductase [Aliidiomarina minuta]RUO25911.1 short chain dehydrogenase [Aliidiomarina minuta]
MRKNIVITGASSGLGEEMARQFAAKGRNLGLCARRTDRLEALKAELEKQYPDIKVSIKALDVNDHDQVFEVIKAFKAEFGQLDRMIVNAGMGKGAGIGKGYFAANKMTAETNYIAAMAQCEAAMEIFREQNNGHLVTISSMSAIRGMPGAMTSYASSKAALVALTEGIRADVMRKPIAVSCIMPGYIRSELNEKVKDTPYMVDTVPGVKAMVKQIEKEVGSAYVPWWPWAPLGYVMKRLPLKWLRYLL